MSRGLRNPLVLLALLLVSGCGSDTTTQSSTGSSTGSTGNTTTTQNSEITWAVSPSPVPAVVSNDSNYSWKGSFTVTLTESKGVGVKVQSLKADLQQAAGGIVITPPAGFDESFRFTVSSPSNRVEGKGSLPLDFTFFYTLPNSGKEALVAVTFTVVDDSGSSATIATEATIK
jgi:uncharacterized protein YceK